VSFAFRRDEDGPLAWPQCRDGNLARASLAVPIVTGVRTIGALSVYRTEARPFESQEARVLSLLAEGAAMALENQRLLAQEEERRRRATALMQVAQATTSTLDLNEVLDRVVETTVRLTGADRGSIWLFDQTKTQLLSAAIYGTDPEFAAQWRRRAFRLEEENLSYWVLTHGEPLAIYDAASHPLTDKRAVSFFGDKSILVMPLSWRMRRWALSSSTTSTATMPSPAEEVEFTLTLASQAAVAISNAQLYARSREEGEALRWSMRQLGSMPATPNLDEVCNSSSMWRRAS